MNGNPSSLDKSIDSKDDDKSESEQYLNPSSPDNELAIFVYNIDPEVPQDQFKTIFGSFGSITKLTYNSVTPTKPFVYILYERPESADKALKEAQYMQIGRLEILVCKRQEGSKLNPRGKLFVRGIADEITLRDLHQHFGQVSFNFLVFKFGPQDLRPLNTGFVHFFDPKDAQKALDTLQNKEVKESKLELSEWDPQGLKRAKASQSLYIANLPDMSKRDIESQYMAIFKSFGEIVSFIFNDVKFNGVLAYKEHKDAQEAFENLTKKEGCAGLSVSWVKSASERKEEMKKRKNRLHLDGLRFDISHEMIKSEFGRFGQVVSLDTKPGRIVERRIKTQWAVIAFSTDEEAERALIDGPRTREIKKLFVMNYLKIQYLGQPNKDQSPNHSHNNNNNPNRMNKNQYFSKSKPQSLHETTPKAHPDSHPELSEPQESQFPPGMQPFSGSQPLIPFDEQLPPHMIQPQAQHFNQPMMFSHMLGQPQPQPQVQYSPFNFMQMNPPQFPSLSQPPMMNMSPSAQNSQPQGFIQPPPGFNLMGTPSLGNPTPQFPGLGGWPQQDEVLNNNRISNSLNNNEFFNLSNLGNLGNIMPPMNNFHGAGDIGQPQKNVLDPGYGDLVEGAELNDQIMFNLSFMDEKPAEPIKPTQPIQSTQTTQPTEPLNVGSINPEDFLKKSLGIM